MEKEQALQALLDQVVRQGDFIGVSALYLRDGKQLAYAQAGMANRERGIPFARDTICRVFSMSKPITAFAVMKLWEDGKLDLDAPVAAYLPEFGDAEHTNLTIRQLLCMTSGYGYNDNDSVQSAGLGRLYDEISESFRFLYKGIIIKHNKTEPTYTKTSLFLCEKRRFFMARTEKGVVATI